MPETKREFFERRYRELRSTEWGRISEMNMDDLMEMLEHEYYECAFEPVPPSIPIAH